MRKLAIAAALAFALPGAAGQGLSTSVEELASAAQLVVRGRVARVTSRWSDDGLRIFTYAEVETSSTWKGTPAPRVTVLVPGGVVGRIGQRVDGAPTFAEGEEVVAFLHRAEAGAHRVTGLAQGKFTVEAGVARPDLSHVRLAGAPLGPGERRAEAMPVEELERRVRSAR
jgi:hypothetical protein